MKKKDFGRCIRFQREREKERVKEKRRREKRVRGLIETSSERLWQLSDSWTCRVYFMPYDLWIQIDRDAREKSRVDGTPPKQNEKRSTSPRSMHTLRIFKYIPRTSFFFIVFSVQTNLLHFCATNLHVHSNPLKNKWSCHVIPFILIISYAFYCVPNTSRAHYKPPKMQLSPFFSYCILIYRVNFVPDPNFNTKEGKNASIFSIFNRVHAAVNISKKTQ